MLGGRVCIEYLSVLIDQYLVVLVNRCSISSYDHHIHYLTSSLLPHDIIIMICWSPDISIISHPFTTRNPREVLLVQLSLYVYKGELKTHSFHFLHPVGSFGPVLARNADSKLGSNLSRIGCCMWYCAL